MSCQQLSPLEIYKSAVAVRALASKRASEAADQFFAGAEMLRLPPTEWRFGSGTDQGAVETSAGEQIAGFAIDPANWPSVGYLMALHLNWIDADRRVNEAFATLSVEEKAAMALEG